MPSNHIVEIYNRLYGFFGPQHWWPGDSPFEIMVGAVLTQNTNWSNVEKAIHALKNSNLLSYEGLSDLPIETMAGLIRSSGYYNLKAKRLKNLLALVGEEFDGNLERLFELPLEELREKLLSVKGVGPETADSIILYAANLPTFVVDAYTHRILFRHGIIEDDASYDAIQELFMGALALDVKLFNEYHALIVRTGKEYCRKKNPDCENCPLSELLA